MMTRPNFPQYSSNHPNSEGVSERGLPEAHFTVQSDLGDLDDDQEAARDVEAALRGPVYNYGIQSSNSSVSRRLDMPLDFNGDEV